MKRLLPVLLILALPVASLAETVPTAAPEATVEITAAPEVSATAEAAETPEATEEATEAPVVWQLTVNFLYEDGSEAEKSVTMQLAAGAEYDVELPEIDGYEPDPGKVRGTMPEADLKIDVKYIPVEAATAEPTAAPTVEPTTEPTAEPEATPAAGLTLTIHYVMGEDAFDGMGQGSGAEDARGTPAPETTAEPGDDATAQPTATPLADDYVLTGLQEGDAYDVVSPVIEGFSPDMERVTGVMGAESVVITVTYTRSMNGFPGGMGGFPGGMGGMNGMLGMEGMEAGFHVTPGEALTDIHTSGDCKTLIYGCVVLTGDEASPLEDDSGERLAIQLLQDGESVAFAAEIEEDTLILTGEAGCWQVGGAALKCLAQSGVTRLVLVTGGESAWMPTEGFASGFAWDRLQMQGMPSARFVYELDAAEQTMRLNVADATYSAEDISAVVQFGTADAWRQNG